MRVTSILFSGRSAWKGAVLGVDQGDDRLTSENTGPYFVAFPNLREALANNVPIKTDARSCTILPNFVG